MVSSIPYVIALYMRLSMEGSRTDSQSIENQKLSLHRYVDSMVESMRDVQNAEVLEFWTVKSSLTKRHNNPVG